MTWAVGFSPAADRHINALDAVVRTRVLNAIAKLARDPYAASNVKALADGLYRLRVGDWRVVYDMRTADVLILVVKVAHRREVYRRP